MTVQSRYRFRRSRLVRLTVVALAVALAGVTPAARAHHGTPGARDLAGACPELQVPDAGYADMAGWPDGFTDAVDCIVAYGITLGTSQTAYSPADAVTRGQMASFVMRMLDPTTGYNRPSNPPDAFTDDVASVHHANINAAAADSLVKGYPGGLFRPGAPVTRAQMATFIVGVLKRTGASLPATSPNAFADDDGDVHEKNIDALADVHVVVGDPSGGYGPHRPVTRAQMALFVARGLDYLVAEDRLVPPFDPTAPRNVVATALTKSTARITWDPPSEGTPDTYNVYRVLAPGGGDCPLTGHSKVGSVSAAAGGGRTYDDAEGLTAGATYCYRVSAVEGTKESELSAPSAKARVTMPTGVQIATGEVDTGAETVSLEYTENVTCASGAASQFSYGGASSPTPTSVTCDGTTKVVLRFANATGPGELTYRQSVETPEARVKQAGTDAYALSPQTVVVTDGVPEISQVSADAAADTVTLLYSETVRCVAGSRGQFTYAGVLATAIDGCEDGPTTTVLLSVPVSGPGSVVYTQSADPALRVTDEGGNGAKSPQTVADAPPKMVKAVADTGTNQIVVTYDEAITCPSGFHGQFSFDKASPATPTSGTCSTTAPTATLTFTSVSGPGALTYAPSATANQRITDKVGQAAPQQAITSDAKPIMVQAVPDLSTNVLTVTYSEAVDCVVAARERFTYQSVKPTDALCKGTATVVLSFAVITGNGSGTLAYVPGGTTNEATWVRDLAGNPAISQSLAVGPAVAEITQVKVDAKATTPTVTVTYNTNVTCVDGSKAQFTYGGATAQSASCSGGSILALTFESITEPGTLGYTQSGDASLRVKDSAGNAAKSPDSGTDGGPGAPDTATGASVAGTVTLAYDEDVYCGDITTAYSYTATGGSEAQPTSVSCSGLSVVLTFAGTVLRGTLTYTAPADPAGRVHDSALNAAANFTNMTVG